MYYNNEHVYFSNALMWFLRRTETPTITLERQGNMVTTSTNDGWSCEAVGPALIIDILSPSLPPSAPPPLPSLPPSPALPLGAAGAAAPSPPPFPPSPATWRHALMNHAHARANRAHARANEAHADANRAHADANEFHASSNRAYASAKLAMAAEELQRLRAKAAETCKSYNWCG